MVLKDDCQVLTNSHPKVIFSAMACVVFKSCQSSLLYHADGFTLFALSYLYDVHPWF
jgi:hypothetical protein